ncbi:MAG: hypothetical protein PHC29_01105 [Candidatus Omnitrophica bacterium]|nr:hypothetical protein [Candidatus Omnitrophota bacterium]
MVRAKVKAKKGAKLVCVPCGSEVIISNFGVSRKTLWCCGKAMQKKKAKPTKKNKRRQG